MDKNRIKSAQFIDTYYPTVDGVVQTVANYAKLMNEISYSMVVAPKNPEKYIDEFSYDVLRTAAIKIPFWEYSLPVPKLDLNLKKSLKSREFDIFHAHSPFTVGMYAESLGKSLNIPVVATFHSKYYDDVLRLTGSKFIAEQITNMVVRFYQKADSVWSVSNGTAETLKSYGYKGDIFVINNGTDFSEPTNSQELKEIVAQKFAIPKDKKIILFVGHQIWQKNLKLVLDTYRRILDKSDDYRLVIVGNGYAEKEIKNYSAKLGFSKRQVIFTGKISDRNLLSGMFLCGDLFFFPSVYDNAPLVVREAAQMGLPALLTKGSNAAETVEHNISGFVAEENAEDMEKEIFRIFETEGLLKTAGENAKKTIPVPWKEIIPIVLDKYAEIIEAKRK